VLKYSEGFSNGVSKIRKYTDRMKFAALSLCDLYKVKVNVKCASVQALRLCTGTEAMYRH